MVTRDALRNGLIVRVGANEPISAELELLVAPRRASTARLPHLALATLPMTSRAGPRTVRLKPTRALRGTGRIRAELRVVAYDPAANRSVITIKFIVR
jgi:hypothetical protein